MTAISENLDQIYLSNPSTTVGNNDLFYIAQSPYSTNNDSAIKYSDLFTEIQTTLTTPTLIGLTPTLNFNGTTSNTITTLAGVSGATGTAASPLTFTMGNSGNSTGANTGANGATFTITGSNAGNSVTGIAGNGGNINFTTGNAGSSSALNSTAAGAFNFNGGKGCTLTSGSATAGTGGQIDFTGGAGGDQQGTGTPGAGGGILFTGGLAGTPTNGNGGIGGSITFTNGPGGNATSTNGNGGASGNIRSFNNAGGNALGTGTGGKGGNLNFTAANGGNSPGGTAGQAGNVTIASGNTGTGVTAATPPTFTLSSGTVGALTSGTNAGGNSGSLTFATATGGAAFAGNGGNSGLISLTTGLGANSTGTNQNGGNSGILELITDAGGNSIDAGTGGNAGNISITGGNGGTSVSGTGGIGSSVTIAAGNGGVGGGSNGANGTIKLKNSDSTWIWPLSDSANFMKSDGSGNLSFSALPTPLFALGYLYGLQCAPSFSNFTQFETTAGECIDSTNTLNMSLPFAYNGDMTVSGAGGLDTGSFAPSSIYCIYVIGDSTGVNTPVTIASLGQNGPTAMPAGYDKYRYIMTLFSDSNTHLIKSICSGTGVSKDVVVDFAAESVILSSGTSSSQTSIGTIASLLSDNNSIQKIKFVASFQAATVTDYAFVTPHGFSIANNSAPIVIGSGILTQVDVPFELSPSPSFQIDYLVTHTGAGNSTLTLLITGFTLAL